MRSSTRTWTRVEQLVSTLQKRWDSGRYLRAYAAGDKWAPITLPVKGPSAEDLLDHFDEARKWTADFERDAGSGGTGSERFSVDYRMLRGRNLGVNRIPARIRIDSSSSSAICWTGRAKFGPSTASSKKPDSASRRPRHGSPVIHWSPWAIGTSGTRCSPPWCGSRPVRTVGSTCAR